MNTPRVLPRYVRAEVAAILRKCSPEISYTLRHETHQVEISIVVDEEWAYVVAELLAFMDNMARHIRSNAEAGFRDFRVEQMLADLNAKYSVVRDVYSAFRASGWKHRESVYKLVSDRSLPFHGRWTYTDYNACVRLTLP